MERHPPSEINVLIVGAGLGGLYCAIELYRQGHSVRVIEMKDGVEALGDFVGIGPSATRQFQKWPGMWETYRSIIYRPALMFLKHDGEVLGGPFELSESANLYRPVPVSRPKMVNALYQYAISLGIVVTFGKRVMDYEESDKTNSACAITDQGERFEADIIVAADGIGTKVGKVMPGEDTKAVSSGFSAYRVAFPTKVTYEDPFLAEQYALREGGPDHCQVFVGPKCQAIVMVAPDVTTWILTHEDKGQAAETWSRRLNAPDVIDSLDKGIEWDPRVLAIMKRTPPNTVVDFRITWRDPNPIWSSSGGRIVKLGDCAHAFLPNSANGATQAMEDGASLAACLRLAGKHNISLATRLHTKLRYERVSCAQRAGFKNRERWHTTDFEAVRKNPMILAMAVGRWVIEHDPEQYVYDNWEPCLNHLISGAPFKNTNIPPGYTFEPWTVEGLTKLSDDGQLLDDGGDWE